MKPIRVYELAKELGVSNEDVISAATDSGVDVSTRSSFIAPQAAQKIRTRLSSPSAASGEKSTGNGVKVSRSESDEVIEKRSSERVVRRRKKKEKPAAAPESEEKQTPGSERETAQESVSPPAGTKTPADSKPQKAATPKADPEKEKLAEQMREALVPKLTPKKTEYVVDEKNFRRKQDIRRKKPPQIRQVSSSARQAPSAPPAGKKNVRIGETILLDDLARRMEVRLRDVRAKAKSMGLDTRSDSPLDYETATLIAAEYGLDVKVDRFDESVYLDDKEAGFANEASRPPVVSVMGHVDHGKTTLLDSFRKSNVASGEAGGITQRIGAYKVVSGDRQIVFIDTPGHEAFTSMRARGARINDMVILVVAADDGVMAQTIEAVNHTKAAGVPVIVAVNKIDKEDSDPEGVKRQLSEHGILSEEWGGDTPFTEISAKTGQGMGDLLELILLQSEILALKAPQTGLAKGVVLESRLDKGRGAVADVIVNKGTLKVGDYLVSGLFSGKVRALYDESGARLKSAGPSIPVEITGLSGVPAAGENFHVLRDEKTARAIVENRLTELERKEAQPVPQPLSLDSIEMMKPPEEDAPKELLLVIKADTQGSLEVIKDSIERLRTEKCLVKTVHSGVGGISAADVELAGVTKAVILGFNVRPDTKVSSEGASRGVLIETYSVLYEIMERIERIMEGLLDPVVEEETVGSAQVLELFRMSGQRAIAGCKVSDGKISRGDNVRVVRDGTLVYQSKVGSLKRFKDDVKEVQSGYECGLTVENFNDIKVGDVLETYSIKETAQQL